MRDPKTINDALRELAYIHDTAKSGDLSSFNGDRECFGRYVHMQADHYARLGFTTTAAEMRRALLLRTKS